METHWIEEKQLEKALARNEAFWNGELEEYPLIWVIAPNARHGQSIAEPDEEEKMWTDVDYVISAAEYQLCRTYYAGDALPVFNPWLGPDQFAGWLGADLILKPKDFTSWVKPFVDDWEKYPQLKIDPDNRWWKLYLETVHASVEAGKGKWVTAYPDLHTGIDGLGAIRGPENLMIDMMTRPEIIRRAMRQMTDLWKYVVDIVSDIVLPAGQGTSNWAMGWSQKRFLCIGQNDFSCLVSPEMFRDFCRQDNLECCDYVDHSLYHLDGPGAARHLPTLLELASLDAIQWIEGANNPRPSQWLDMLRKIQQSGKSVQVTYLPATNTEPFDIFTEIEILCEHLDHTKLFIWTIAETVEQADSIVDHARRICLRKRNF